MKSRWVLVVTASVLFVGDLAKAASGTLSIANTPILNAALPAGATYQVEYTTNASTWIATGVLVAGTGTNNAVRLDGFPESASYRLSAIGSVATVTPVVSKGLHLHPAFPGASELRIESLNTLGTADWTNRAFVFTNLQGAFISPLRPPFTNAEFFRALQPAAPLTTATVTYYTPNTNANAAGYGIVADDMPEIYRAGYIAAPCPAIYNRGGANAAGAGECYELVGPQGKTTVMVADTVSDSPPGTCDVGRPYFDIGIAAFTNLFPATAGIGPVTFRLVPAPVVGNIKMLCVINSGGFYTELRPYNHRAGVSKLEVQAAASDPWIELPRTTYNSFVYSSSPPLATPFNCRITSRFGEIITFPSLTSLTNGSRFTANGQFTSFPDQGPSPIWIVPPVYTEEFTNHLGAPWNATSSGGVGVNPNYSGSAYQGSYSLRLTDLTAFSGVSFSLPTYQFPKPTDGFLEFAIRSEGSAINTLNVTIRGYDAGGATVNRRNSANH
ncbi:MAG TPA: hypothetical protein VFZ59_09510 [Verrucomicrobiae bacterium]|nr:hypothetical protein [Verrucomicrobiae bacterium]